MTTINAGYQMFVLSRTKFGREILDHLTSDQAHLMHMALLATSEAGELADAVKKHCIYGKSLDRDNVKEELGDLLFAIAGTATALGWTLDEIAEANRAKLEKRYPGGYSDAAAVARADKKEVQP